MSKRRFTLEEKLQMLAWIDEGHGVSDAACRFGVGERSICRWRAKLDVHGTEALTKQLQNARYPAELKKQAVEAYLAGEGSQEVICLRYGIEQAPGFMLYVQRKVVPNRLLVQPCRT